MEKKTDNIKVPGSTAKTDEQLAFEGIPVYPASEDIYNRSKEEQDIDPEDISAVKAPNATDADAGNEKDFKEDPFGDDLDIPGAELDDEEEAIGNEDEENNHYSLGGDNHNDLDEDKGE
ncbi:hypothetical protein [Ferruginibacter sp. SUN106]|uniref:hypothetical protein n=1 Tax=Ferruginibacter sp. SUN106 TaxID=2978348 RepID=UPI003D35E5AA